MLIKEKIQTFFAYDNRLSFTRRLLGLEGNPPSLRSLQYMEGDNGSFYLQRIPKIEFEKQLNKWHQEGWRGHLSETLARLPAIGQEQWRKSSDVIYEWRSLRQLLKATHLDYTSFYVHPKENCQQVEGYFNFKKGLAVAVTISTAKHYQIIAEHEWQEGEAFIDNAHSFHPAVTIIVPADQLDTAVIKEALQRWYKETVEYKQGHWTHLSDLQPTLSINLSFSAEN